MNNKSVEERFWAKVKKSDDGCWEWTAARNPNGYGTFNFEGRRINAHRMAWWLVYGEPERGVEICHHCDNKPCVRPDHLFSGTHRDNMHDAFRKGISSPVREQPNFKPAWSDRRAWNIETIKSMRAAGARFRDIGKRFGISTSHAGRLCSGKSPKVARDLTGSRASGTASRTDNGAVFSVLEVRHA